jgi:hypothetical protein
LSPLTEPSCFSPPRPHPALLPQSLLSAVKSSFAALQRRLGPASESGDGLPTERPVFKLDLQLLVPRVVPSPSLDELQQSIGAAAKLVRLVSWLALVHPPHHARPPLPGSSAPRPSLHGRLLVCFSQIAACRAALEKQVLVHLPVNPVPLAPPQVLQAGEQLRGWGSAGGGSTYADMLAADPAVVQLLPLLTGSVEGMKAAVQEHLSACSGGMGGGGGSACLSAGCLCPPARGGCRRKLHSLCHVGPGL